MQGIIIVEDSLSGINAGLIIVEISQIVGTKRLVFRVSIILVE